MNIITAFERDTTAYETFPWTPEKIRFYSGGQLFAEYTIMDWGDVQVPTGKGLRKVSWDGVLPGEAMKNMPWQNGEWKDPKHLQGCFSMWQNYHTPLLLVVSGTPICMNVQLSDYRFTYKDAMGSYHYTVEFTEDIAPAYIVENIQEGIERDDVPLMDTYTVVPGDTIWSIAEKFLGDASRSDELYQLNAEAIDERARQGGYGSSANGMLLFVGVTLKIPGAKENISTEKEAGMEIQLNNAPIYVSSDADTASGNVSGTYYIYDGENVLGRYRITDSEANVRRTPIGQYVVGWLPGEYI